jgi:hypothetical protein
MRGRLLNEKVVANGPPASTNRPVRWRRSSLYNNPLLFVIPSEAEGSAVPRTFRGNVFLCASLRDRQLLFQKLLLEQIRVIPVLGQQLVVRAQLDDTAGDQHSNLIRVTNR